MADYIYVDHAKLEAATVQLGQHHESFVEILNDLQRDLAPLMDTWSGSARDLYVEKQGQWNAAADDLATLLRSIVKVTGDAHTNYARNVDDLTWMWT